MYQALNRYLSKLPAFQGWAQPNTILGRCSASQPRDWKLPLVTCESICGSTEPGIAASAALACVQIAILLVDDILDGDPRGEFQRIGYGQAANLATTFLSAGQQAILYSEANPEIKLKTLHVLNEMIPIVSYGQYLDLMTPPDENTYWRIVRNKSGAFFSSAIVMGALFGGAPDQTTKGLETVGRIYGEMIQIHDDLHDCMEQPANPDWLQGRSPLPILFARRVDHPDRARFVKLQQNITAEAALEEAQAILIRCGAVSYCVHVLMQKWETSRELLRRIRLKNAIVLQSLLDEVAEPIHRLLESA